MDKNHKKDCLLCSNLDHEIIPILQQVQIKLYQVQKKSSFIHNQNDSQMNKNSQGFYRLIRIIFSNKLKHSKASLICRHEQIKRRFMKNLKCPINTLNILCDQLSSILGKFNFHVDVLIQQLKGFQRYLRAQTGQIENQQPLIKQQHQEIIQRTSQISESKEKSNESKGKSSILRQDKILDNINVSMSKKIKDPLDQGTRNFPIVSNNTPSISEREREQPLQDKTNQMNFMNLSTNMNISPSPMSMPNLFYSGMNMLWFYQNNQGNM